PSGPHEPGKCPGGFPLIPADSGDSRRSGERGAVGGGTWSSVRARSHAVRDTKRCSAAAGPGGEGCKPIDGRLSLHRHDLLSAHGELAGRLARVAAASRVMAYLAECLRSSMATRRLKSPGKAFEYIG